MCVTAQSLGEIQRQATVILSGKPLGIVVKEAQRQGVEVWDRRGPTEARCGFYPGTHLKEAGRAG